MKKISLSILSLIVLMAGYACSEIDKILTFNIQNEANFSVPSTIGINTPFVVQTPDIQTNSTQEFANNNTKKDLVKDVRLSSLNLKITSPTNMNFGFLKSINLYISAEGVSEKKIAYLTDIPENVGSSIDLIPTDEKLDDIIKQDKYSIRTEVVTDKTFFQDIEIKAKMNFKVTADVL
jgi:hypothetical protein